MLKPNFRHICVGTVLLLLACNIEVLAKPGGKHNSKVGAVADLLPSGALRPGTSLEGLPPHPPQSVDEAVAAFQRQLVRDHEEQFSSLLSKQTLLSAIRSAQQNYEEDKPGLQSAFRGNYYQKNVDLMQHITHGGRWPRGAYLSAFYQMTDVKGITYHGIGVRLSVRDPQHPSQQLVGSSWPILDVWYGHGE